VIEAVAKSDSFEQFGCALVPIGGLDAAEEHRQFDVLERGDVRQEIESLKDESDASIADLGQLVARDAGDGLASDLVDARGRRIAR
jgi:hypothetical protein